MTLPQQIGQLQQLSSLFVYNNSLRELPRSLCQLTALKHVFISLVDLSSCVPFNASLQLGLDGNANMTFPPLSVCYLGVRAVMAALAQPAEGPDTQAGPASQSVHLCTFLISNTHFVLRCLW